MTKISHRKLVVAGLIIACFAFGAAGNYEYAEPDIDNAGKKVESKLYSKYKTEATIVSSERGSNGGGPFGRESLFFDLHSNKGDFVASTDLDGKNMEDNYAKLLFGGEVEKGFREIAESYPSLDVEYQLTQWLSQDT